MKKVDKYLPKASIELISSWLKKYQCELEIKKPRKSKLGDYQFCQKLKQHKIIKRAVRMMTANIESASYPIQRQEDIESR